MLVVTYETGNVIGVSVAKRSTMEDNKGHKKAILPCAMNAMRSIIEDLLLLHFGQTIVLSIHLEERARAHQGHVIYVTFPMDIKIVVLMYQNV